uniref:Titin n=1 Tax=Cyprinus carpio TaxID=7962 RepID=A0A8C1WD03_CYPCA
MLRIDAEISGRPIPVISWAKDGKEIEAKARFEISSTLTSTTLIVRDAIRRDSGQYVLTLQNVAGTRSLAVNCKVLDRPGPSAGPLEVTGLTAEKCTLTWGPPQENGGAEIHAPSVPCPLTKAEDPLFLPSPPAKPKIIDSSKTSITLSWNKPLFDGGSPVTGYMVEYRNTTDDDWTLGVSNTKSTEFTVVGLTSGAEYVFVVRSINKIGPSEPSPETDPQIAKDREDEPIFLISSNLKIEIPLTGKPQPKVSLSKDGQVLKSTMRFNSDVTTDSLIIYLRESVASDAGRYDITASNSSGTTKSFVNIVVLDRPSPPVGPVEMCDVTEDSVSLKWLPPAYDGGSPITNYIVFKRETTTANWVEVSSAVARCTIKIMKLINGVEYQFRIRAENRFGISDHIDSPTVTVTTVGPVTCVDTYGAPEIEFPPEYLDVVKYKAGATVHLKIGIIAKPQPTIEWYKDGKELDRILWSIISEKLEDCIVTVPRLIKGNEYIFRVRGVNKYGVGDPLESRPVIAQNSFGKEKF